MKQHAPLGGGAAHFMFGRTSADAVLRFSSCEDFVHRVQNDHCGAERNIQINHRQILASAACDAATRWGFAVRGWQRIQATTLVANTASQRVLVKCGYQREGLLRNFRRVRGQPADYWMFATVPGDRT